MTTQPEFPKLSNSVLTQEEKLFLDKVPDEGVAYMMRNPGTDITASFVANDLSVSMFYKFEGERADAVRDYFEMLFAYGLRKDPRVL